MANNNIQNGIIVDGIVYETKVDGGCGDCNFESCRCSAICDYFDYKFKKHTYFVKVKENET